MNALLPDRSDPVADFLAEISDWADFHDLGPMHVNSRRKPYGSTPLKIACVQGRADLVEALLKAGARIDQRNEDEMTALQYAVTQGHEEVARVLVRAGADLSSIDIYGHSALDYARTETMQAILLRKA